jgi:hypothetical protein
LQYCGKAEQSDENFEQISKSPVAHKPINQVKANRTDDYDNQHVYECEKHSADSQSQIKIEVVLSDGLLVIVI